MIRERRNKEKLLQYYQKFIADGVLDPNVHPWVAASWQRSREQKVAHDVMRPLVTLRKKELAARQERHAAAIDYLGGLYQEIREHFNVYNLSLVLLDQESYCLKSYALSFYQKTPGELEGARLAEEDIGTSSISLALEHQTLFLLFGPEMWIAECQSGDACSAPVLVNGQVAYVVTLVSVQQEELPYTALVSLLLSMKYGLEKHLSLLSGLAVRDTILDAAPLVAYQVMPDGKVAYANRLGQSRLTGPNLSETILNYQHTPIYRGFKGIPVHNKEVTWITARKTYEDITTVIPLLQDGESTSVVSVSLPIENLQMLLAHAAGYTARYSLASMVGETAAFLSMKKKAGRAAHSNHHLLLQGESGTGKQRLAHGIHQAGERAAGPLIAIKCGDMPADLLETELFGTTHQGDENRAGKFELAQGGTLLLDEVEKMPAHLANRLAQALATKQVSRPGKSKGCPMDVRIIAACDGDLKRLTEKQLFSAALYEMIGKTVIRIPSLRNRREDIPLLAAHIVTELAEQNHLPTKTILPQAAQFLLLYDWPGNVKQLQGVVEHAFFHTSGEEITVADIRLPGRGSIGMAWKEDREAFIEVWKAARGNISRMANMLDVSRVTLYRYLRKYGLEK